jgi:AraC-like DNA-binding protein
MSDLEHMSRFERVLYNGSEWPLSTHHWVVLQLSEGIAYAHSAGTSQEVLAGGVVLSPPGSSASILASTLGPATVRGVAVRMNSLTGFLTAIERQCFETQIAPRCAPFLILPPTHPLGAQLSVICDRRNTMALQDRLGFLHVFSEVLSPYLTEAMAQGDTGHQDAVARLRQFVNEMPESELAELSLAQLAEHLHCCERHASRLFQELCGCSFRAHISELRLKKACALLANPKLKIIDVAIESGHSSLAFFNYRFKKRFGVTPTEWRERHATRERPLSRPGPARRAVAMVMASSLVFVALGLC